MIPAPPILDGAVHVNDTCVLPEVPATLVGAPGTVVDETIAKDELVETVSAAVSSVKVSPVPVDDGFVIPAIVNVAAVETGRLQPEVLNVTVTVRLVVEPSAAQPENPDVKAMVGVLGIVNPDGNTTVMVLLLFELRAPVEVLLKLMVHVVVAPATSDTAEEETAVTAAASVDCALPNRTDPLTTPASTKRRARLCLLARFTACNILHRTAECTVCYGDEAVWSEKQWLKYCESRSRCRNHRCGAGHQQVDRSAT